MVRAVEPQINRCRGGSQHTGQACATHHHIGCLVAAQQLEDRIDGPAVGGGARQRHTSIPVGRVGSSRAGRRHVLGRAAAGPATVRVAPLARARRLSTWPRRLLRQLGKVNAEGLGSLPGRKGRAGRADRTRRRRDVVRKTPNTRSPTIRHMRSGSMSVADSMAVTGASSRTGRNGTSMKLRWVAPWIWKVYPGRAVRSTVRHPPKVMSFSASNQAVSGAIPAFTASSAVTANSRWWDRTCRAGRSSPAVPTSDHTAPSRFTAARQRGSSRHHCSAATPPNECPVDFKNKDAVEQIDEFREVS
jgi:hypothetical protein